MMGDDCGLPVTTASPDALERYERGAQGLLGWDRSALDHFGAASGHDPGLALAHAGRGVCLFLEERFEEARTAVERARGAAAGQSELVDVGGSRAQRDVFHDTLLEACFRAGDMERAERLLAERLARRPDHLWRTRRAHIPAG